MENIAYCNGCPRGCPVNALHCGKGCAYLEEQHREGKLLEIPLPERVEGAQRGHGRGHGQGHAMHPNRGYGRYGEEQGVDHDGDSTDEARECNDGPDCGIDREAGMRFHADGGHGYGHRPDKGRGWRGRQGVDHDGNSTDEAQECSDGPDCGIDREAGMRFHADGGHGYGRRPGKGRGWRGGDGFEHDDSTDEARECSDGPDCGVDREAGVRFHADGGHSYGRRPDKGRGWRGGQGFDHDGDSTDEAHECNDGPDCGVDREAGVRFHADGGHGYGRRPGKGRGWRGGHGFEAEASDDLYTLMRACGHILYHQGGRKSGQGRILRILSHCEAMSQRELQEVLGIQTGSLSEILAKLENAGFIERERDEADRRRSVVRLTPAGRNHAEECCRDGERQDMFSALDEGQREQLKKLLTILLADWKA